MAVTRFAPSPTGLLHLGHAYAALFAFRAASPGSFLLRIEDIDPVRCRPEFVNSLFEDLRWLGLSWKEPVRFQSQHIDDYEAALNVLRDRQLLYPCFCTRQDIADEIHRSAHAPHSEDGTFMYPGTCRHLSQEQRREKLQLHKKANWRLDCARAFKEVGPLFWHDKRHGNTEVRPDLVGDVVLARKDIATSYHLSVVVDDHLQGISLVTRGEDLLPSTHIHRLLQALFKYEVPEYDHHKLLLDHSGRRYAKRDKAVTLQTFRNQGQSAEDIFKLLEI
jgi:glutamyl-Q tRNA(Asp) synthetase